MGKRIFSETFPRGETSLIPSSPIREIPSPNTPPLTIDKNSRISRDPFSARMSRNYTLDSRVAEAIHPVFRNNQILRSFQEEKLHNDFKIEIQQIFNQINNSSKDKVEFHTDPWTAELSKKTIPQTQITIHRELLKILQTLDEDALKRLTAYSQTSFSLTYLKDTLRNTLNTFENLQRINRLQNADQINAFKCFVQILANQGRSQEALDVIVQHFPDDEQSLARAKLAKIVADQENFLQSIEIAKKIKDPLLRLHTFVSISTSIIGLAKPQSFHQLTVIQPPLTAPQCLTLAMQAAHEITTKKLREETFENIIKYLGQAPHEPLIDTVEPRKKTIQFFELPLDTLENLQTALYEYLILENHSQPSLQEEILQILISEGYIKNALQLTPDGLKQNTLQQAIYALFFKYGPEGVIEFAKQHAPVKDDLLPLVVQSCLLPVESLSEDELDPVARLAIYLTRQDQMKVQELIHRTQDPLTKQLLLEKIIKEATIRKDFISAYQTTALLPFESQKTTYLSIKKECSYATKIFAIQGQVTQAIHLVNVPEDVLTFMTQFEEKNPISSQLASIIKILISRKCFTQATKVIEILPTQTEKEIFYEKIAALQK